MSVSIVCPSCSKSYEVSEKAIGKKVKCGCGVTFVAEQSNDPYDSAFDESDRFSDTESDSDAPSTQISVPSTARSMPPEPTSSPPSFNWGRYPNLRFYLGWVSFVARFQLFCSILLFFIMCTLSILVIAQAPGPLSMGDVQLLASVGFSGLMIVVVSLLTYFAMRAAVEFVTVIVHAEYAVRMQAIYSGAIADDGIG